MHTGELVMNYVIAVFVSRSETLSFANMLKRMGIPVMVIQTPKEAGRTCGLSAKFSYNDFNDAKSIMQKMNFSSFQGFYLQQTTSGQPFILR